MRIRVGHLYPDYLNIYADRGNIAVLARRAALRAATSSRSRAIAMGDALARASTTSSTSAAARIASRRSSRPTSPRSADGAARGARGGAAVLAVCGGYQLLGRSLPRPRRRRAARASALLPLETVAGERRMIGDVLLDCELGRRRHAGRVREPRRAHAARRRRRAARARRRTGSATTARAASRAAAPAGRSARTSTGRSCRATRGSPTGCSRRRSHAQLGEPPELEPLEDELEQEAHRVAASGPTAAAARC